MRAMLIPWILTVMACAEPDGEPPVLPDGGELPRGCGHPDDQGNDKGVGKYCSKGGGQCPITSYARFCSADFRAGAPGFCTNACDKDSDCGAGADCFEEAPGEPKGCRPLACKELPPAEVPPANSPPATPPASDGGTPVCGKPGDVGNSKGVGKYCKTNDDCAGSFAKYCAAANRAGAPPVCTNLCSSEADCGEGASCVSDGSGFKGCVPKSCLGIGADAGSANLDGGSPGCAALATCCGQASFPAALKPVCELTVKGSDAFCGFTLQSYRLSGWCAP